MTAFSWKMRSLTAAVSTAALGLTMLAATPAHAAPGDPINLVVTQTTGTAPFNGDNAPGHDADDTNDIVRTNDTLAWNVSLRYETPQTAPVISFTVPSGAQLVNLPSFCKTPGSSLTPATIPAPTVPLTSTSWQSLPSQSVVCVVADGVPSQSKDYPFAAEIRPEVPQGTQLAPIEFAVSSQEQVTPFTETPNRVTVSAAPSIDLSKRRESSSPNVGPVRTGEYGTCSGAPTRTCTIIEYPVTIDIGPGGKGAAPLASDISFRDDVSPTAFYGPGVTSTPSWTNAGAGALAKYGVRLRSCPTSGSLPGSLPYNGPSSTSPRTEVNSVRNGGTVQCTQPGGPGTPVQISITGIDTSGYTTPTQTQFGSALPADSGYIVSFVVSVEVPLDALQDLAGAGDGNGGTLPMHNAFSDLVAKDLAGTPVTETTAAEANNVRDLVMTAPGRGGSGFLTKSYVGVTGNPKNTPAGQTNSNGTYEGVPGSGPLRDGNTVVAKGQIVASGLQFDRSGLFPNYPEEYLNTDQVCDTWDSTKMQMPVNYNYPGASYTRMRAPNRGEPAWFTQVALGPTTYADPMATNALRNMKVQYGYTATPGTATTNCGNGPWYDTPGAVPNAQSVAGSWQGVNRVRFTFSEGTTGTGNRILVNMGVLLKVVSDDPTGTILPNWAGLSVAQKIVDATAMDADPATTDSLSNYNPTNHTGQPGDRLFLARAQARIKKDVWDSTLGQWVSTTPRYSGGDEVRWRLQASLTSEVDGEQADPVYVEDCLPRGIQYNSATLGGAPLMAEVVQNGAPAGSQLTCPVTSTYVKWNLGNYKANDVIPPLIVTTHVSQAVASGTYTNTTLVSSPADGSPVAARQSQAAIQLQMPSGLAISKSVDRPLTEVNPDGVQGKRSFTWTVTLANLGAAGAVTNADVIDVLPATGLNGSDFQGSLLLNSVNVLAPANVRVLYSKRAPADLRVDPSDASNAAAGSTVWCTAADGTGTVDSGNGTVTDCPQSMSEVTGLRFRRAGAFTVNDTFVIEIKQTGHGNRAADQYINQVAGRANGVTQPAGPQTAKSAVVSSGLGDTVWFDADGDGVQDAGETGVSGVTVRLSGTDIDGNPVSMATTTATDGTYHFTGLTSGDYVVTFDPTTLPAGMEFTTRYAGTNTAVDSNADRTTGASDTIQLPADTVDNTIDAGIRRVLGQVTWSKTGPGGGALGGSQWLLTGPGGFSRVVVDNGAGDEDNAVGALKVTGLDWGTYSLTETQAPTGHTPSATAIPVVIDGTHLDVSVGAVVNARIPGEITWSKTGPGGGALAGSEWLLTAPGGFSRAVVDNGTGDEDNTVGALKVSGLDWGTYTLTETQAPQGHSPSTTPITVTIDAAHVAVAAGAVVNNRIPGEVTWSKTGPGGGALAGSEWTLTAPGGFSLAVVDNGAGDEDNAVGALKVTGLAWGTYALTETKAPVGHDLDPTPIPVTVDATHLTLAVGPVVNQRSTGAVTWTKTGPGGALLGGSEWTLTGPGGYAETIVDNGKGDADPAAGALKVTGLAWGAYTLTETKAPTGYTPDAKPIAFTVDGSHLAVSAGAVVNTPILGAVTWTKTGPGGALLGGSEWTLTGPGGYAETIVDNGKGDADPAAGALKVTGLAWGTYTLTEAKAPAGFVRLTTTWPAVVDGDHLTVSLGAIENQAESAAVTKTKPKIATKTAKKKVVVGSKIFDRVMISGFTKGGTAKGEASLYGPFASRKAATCSPAHLVATRTFKPKNGTVKTGTIRLTEPGYYTWVAKITGDEFNKAATHPCGMKSETTLAHKASYPPVVVNTGFRGVFGPLNLMADLLAARAKVTSLSYAKVGARSRVLPVGIRKGAMNVPLNVNMIGMLRNSAGVGDLIGTTVMAGHVSDYHDRPGVFYRLTQARVGDVVTVKEGGKTHRFKVTGKAMYSRNKVLPKQLFSTTGKHRLVLISCADRITLPGNHFHYAKNVVVTAVPVK